MRHVRVVARFVGGLVAATLLSACAVRTSGQGTRAQPAGPPSASELSAVLPALDDLPTGWKTSPVASTSTDRLNTGLAACVGTRDTTTGYAAQALASNYYSGATFMHAQVSGFYATEQARTELDLMKYPQYLVCVRSQTEDGYSSDEQAQVTASALKFSAAGKSNCPVAIVTLAVESTEDDGPLLIDYAFVFVFSKRLVAELDLTSFDKPFPSSLYQSLVTMTCDRMALAE